MCVYVFILKFSEACFSTRSTQMIMTDSFTAQTEFSSTVFSQHSLPTPNAGTLTPTPAP